MGRKECMESRPTAWVANIERVAPDTSTERQARATAPEHNETQKEEKRPRDIVDANKPVQNPTTHIHLVWVGRSAYSLLFVGHMPTKTRTSLKKNRFYTMAYIIFRRKYSKKMKIYCKNLQEKPTKKKE